MLDPAQECLKIKTDGPRSDGEKVTAHLILSLVLSLYMMVAIYSCVYAARRLARPTINKKIMSVFLTKHYFYVFIFIFVWGCYMGNAYF